MVKEKDCSNKSRTAMVRTTKKSSASQTTLSDLPDKLLELILLHLASPLWLVRVAATCKRWRRIVTDIGFLFRIDRLCHRQAAGHYHYRRQSSRAESYSLTFVPSSPPAAALGIDARHFSLDFLPGGSSSWELIDSRGSVLLLAKRKRSTSSTHHRRRHGFFRDLVVCEPVTRRFQLIPRMGDTKYQHCLGVFLHEINTSSIDMWWRACSTMSRYKVICVVYREYDGISGEIGTVSACVFDPNKGNRWNRRVRYPRWYIAKPSWPMTKCNIHIRGFDSVRFLGHAADAMFWAMRDQDTLLVFDERRTGFEVLRLPKSIRGSELQVVVDGDHDGKLSVICLEGGDLRVFVTWRHGNGEWVLQNNLRLAAATVGLAGYKEGYFRSSTMKIVTASVGSVVLRPMEETKWMFSVNLETMEVVRCKNVSAATYPCELPWLPTLRASVTRCERQGRGLCSHICICDNA